MFTKYFKILKIMCLMGKEKIPWTNTYDWIYLDEIYYFC